MMYKGRAVKFCGIFSLISLDKNERNYNVFF